MDPALTWLMSHTSMPMGVGSEGPSAVRFPPKTDATARLIKKCARQVFLRTSLLVTEELLNLPNSSERRCLFRRRKRRFCPTIKAVVTIGQKHRARLADGRTIAVAKCLPSAIERSTCVIATASCRSQFRRTNDDGKSGRMMSVKATGTLWRGGFPTPKIDLLSRALLGLTPEIDIPSHSSRSGCGRPRDSTGRGRWGTKYLRFASVS